MKVQLSFLSMLAVAAYASKLDATPVQKVLQLMTGMLEKGQKEMHEEEVNYAASSQFCTNNKEQKAAAIEVETAAIAAFTTAVEVATTKAATLTAEIAALQKDSDTLKGDVKAATKVRGLERAEYDLKSAAHTEAIDAIGGAVAILKKKTADKKQGAASLVQLSAVQDLPIIPASAKRALGMFLQGVDQSADEPDLMDMLATVQNKNKNEKNLLQQVDDEAAAPEANAYENQSGGVIDMLEKLQAKFIEERTNEAKKETTNKNVFSLFTQDLTNQINQAAEDMSDKTVSKTKAMELKALKASDKKEQVTMKTDDTKVLKDLTADCTIKERDFVARQKMRSDELDAIKKASAIIGGSAVQGSAEKHMPGGRSKEEKYLAALQKNGNSFGQLRSSSNTQLQSLAAVFLHDQAAKINSRVLEAVAVRAGADPMKKVKKMIKDMIVKLVEEAGAEGTHKGFCDKELGTNKHTRDAKNREVDTLSADIDQLTSTIAKTSETISDLSTAVVALDAGIAEQTTLRAAEKKENEESVNDASEAQMAIAQALTVLKDFYATAAGATSLMQTGTTAPYTGMAGESGGVLAMLEVIDSDFARLESETKVNEDQAEASHKEFISTSRQDKAAKEASLGHHQTKLSNAKATMLTTKSDLEGTQAELTAALRTFEKLKPSCVDSGVSFEDRDARRKEEIDSLKEALKIMQ